MGESPEAKQERAFHAGRLKTPFAAEMSSPGLPRRGGAEALAWGTVQVIAAPCRDYLDPGWEEAGSRTSGTPDVRDSAWVTKMQRPQHAVVHRK